MGTLFFKKEARIYNWTKTDSSINDAGKTGQLFAKEFSNYRTIALISHANKVMLKILQARPQQYVNHELPDVQAGFRKGRGTRDQIANIHWIIEKATEFQKNIYFCFIKKQESFRKSFISALLTMPKPLTVWITINCGKF